MLKSSANAKADRGEAVHCEPVALASSATSRSTGFVWCPYRAATLLQQALTSNKTKVAFLLGAGCPLSIRTSTNEPLIPDIRGLTNRVNSAIQQQEKHKVVLDTIIGQLCRAELPNPTVEHILTHVRSLAEIIGVSNWDGLTKDNLLSFDNLICKEIQRAVHVELPLELNPYHQLAAWVGAIQRIHPVEIFTTNYDLLTEQALVDRGVPYFDGFVGSHRTFFDLIAMEQDKLPARWARLWKIHGSINWYLKDKQVIRGAPDESSNQLLIYPSHLKYAQSRRMPYLAMFDRLRSFLNDPQAVLVTCGYSFSDDHINEVLLHGLNGNQTAQCFGLIFGGRSDAIKAVRAHRCANLNMLAADGAMIGGKDRERSPEEKIGHPLHSLAVKQEHTANANDPPLNTVKKSRFLLGDFKALGEFLASQLAANRQDDEGVYNAP